MLTLAIEETNTRHSILCSLPERIRNITRTLDFSDIFEIRLRRGMPLAVSRIHGIFYITPDGGVTADYKEGYIVTEGDILRGMELITRSSVYAYEDEIRNGYVTLSGGHRVGICGDAVLSSGKISQIRKVHSLNYRIAREVIGCSDSIINSIISAGQIKNTLLVSPPMYGKTTMLRDIARSLSLMGKRVCIVDERGEIAACTTGLPSFDLGANCDVLSGAPKAEGMLFLLRSMAPDVIITDEIGDIADFEAITEIKKRGVKIITSLHGDRGEFPDFENVIFLEGTGKCLSSQAQ